MEISTMEILLCVRSRSQELSAETNRGLYSRGSELVTERLQPERMLRQKKLMECQAEQTWCLPK